MAYLLLFISIVLEVFGSTMLKFSEGFKKLFPSIFVVVGYGLAFYLLSIVLKTLPLGIVYATWSGIGTIFTVCVGVYLFKEKLNKQGYVGIGLLVVGLVIMNMSK
ncbi:DMT family transporter [Metabacillus litoralis]|uniref:DMT family transporter n=1 Tax=Metabacillus litoralis TaxID=152268 RepID=UPI001CFE420D|nr:multidrug efflux SMR transporter [Metabacillus litoralis]